jgi:hypothetical protein
LDRSGIPQRQRDRKPSNFLGKERIQRGNHKGGNTAAIGEV